MKRILILIIKGYQKFISPLFPADMQILSYLFYLFYTSVEKYGFFKGSYLGVRRLLRCHPFNPGGYDPLK